MAKTSAAEDGINPLEKGRRLYQQEDYDAAIQAFSDAIKLSTGSLLLTALDHRASTYEKLGNLHAALGDSRKMLGLAPDLAKGYIRCGKILQAKGEMDVAMSIYERGLKKVKIGTDKNWTLLQLAFNKLRNIQNAGKCLDPLSYLPIEMAVIVMQNLEMRDLVICLAVSKPWKALLDASPELWGTFDTRDTRRAISLHSLKTHLRRSKYKLDTAIITPEAKLDASKLAYLTQTCKQLKRLKMDGSSVIGNSLTGALPMAQNLSTLIIGMNCHISPKAVLIALNTCHNTLVEAKFLAVLGRLNLDDTWPKMKSLECFDLRIREHYSAFFDLNEVVDSMPNVKSLTLFHCDTESHHPRRLDLRYCTQLEYLHLRGDRSPCVPIMPPTIKHLDFSMSEALHELHIERDEVFDLPLLETFDCRGTMLKGPLIKRITSQAVEARSLKRLFIGRPFMDAGMAAVESQYPLSDTVHALHLGSPDISEERIIEVIKLFPNLRSLDVSTSKVTGVAVKEFVNRGVTTLRCNNCYRISPDAIDYARAHGVEVEAKSGNNHNMRDLVYSHRDGPFSIGGN